MTQWSLGVKKRLDMLTYSIVDAVSIWCLMSCNQIALTAFIDQISATSSRLEKGSKPFLSAAKLFIPFHDLLLTFYVFLLHSTLLP